MQRGYDPVTVLVGTDDPKLARRIVRSLSDHYEVRTATSAPEILDSTVSDVDVVVLDVSVPELTYDDVKREIRHYDYDCRILRLAPAEYDSEIVADGDVTLRRSVDREMLRATVSTLVEAVHSRDESRSTSLIRRVVATIERWQSADGTPKENTYLTIDVGSPDGVECDSEPGEDSAGGVALDGEAVSEEAHSERE